MVAGAIAGVGVSSVCDALGRRWPGRPLPGRLPLLVLAAAGLFAFAAWRRGLGARFVWDAVCVLYLLTVIVIDGERRVIPNVLNAAGTGLGVVLLAVLQPIPWPSALTGALVSAGFFHLAAVLYRGGLGGGDLKFAPGFGLYLGWPDALAGLTCGLLFGAATALWRVIRRPPGWREPFAYGPALAAGGLAAVIGGEALLALFIAWPYAV